LSEERTVSYAGPRSWPISAAISLFGTTSGVVSLFVGVRHGIPDVPPLYVLIAILGFFYAAALWMSILGGGSLVFRGPSDDLGSWIVRGRPVSRTVWKMALALCYLSPWIAMVIVIYIFAVS